MADQTQGGLMGIDPTLLSSIGNGLMSAGARHLMIPGNLGESMQTAMGQYYQQKQAQQSLQMNQMQLQMLMAQMPALEKFLSGVDGLMGGPTTQNASPSQPQGLLGPSTPEMPSSVPSIPGVPTGFGAAPMLGAGTIPGQPPQASSQSGAPQSGPDPTQFLRMRVLGAGLPGPAGAISKAMMEYAKAVPAMYDYQIKQRQMAAQARLAPLEGVISSPQAHQIVGNDPGLKAIWEQTAPLMGLNPSNDLTADNAQAVMTMAYNREAGNAGLPTKPMPTKFGRVDVGYGGSENENLLTHERTRLLPREVPTATTQVVTNPDQTQSVRTTPTGGMDAQGRPLATSGPASSGTGVPLPPRAASGDDFKNAELANYMRGGLKGVQGLEDSGYVLPPRARAIILNAATAEGSGLTMQYLQQKLAKSGLSAQDQTYMAALMPILQAVGHSLAGARLTEGQIRQNYESVIPIDLANKPALGQINTNRDAYYRGLLGEAGPAVLTPLYSDTLGSDFKRLSQDSALPVMGPEQARKVIAGLKSGQTLRFRSIDGRVMTAGGSQ